MYSRSVAMPIDQSAQQHLLLAARDGDDATAEMLAKMVNVNHQDSEGDSALILAAGPGIRGLCKVCWPKEPMSGRPIDARKARCLSQAGQGTSTWC